MDTGGLCSSGGRIFGGSRKAVSDSACKTGHRLQGGPRACRVHVRVAEQAVGNHGAKVKVDK